MSFGKNADAILVVEDGLTLSVTFGASCWRWETRLPAPLVDPTHFGATFRPWGFSLWGAKGFYQPNLVTYMYTIHIIQVKCKGNREAVYLFYII